MGGFCRVDPARARVPRTLRHRHRGQNLPRNSSRILLGDCERGSGICLISKASGAIGKIQGSNAPIIVPARYSPRAVACEYTIFLQLGASSLPSASSLESQGVPNRVGRQIHSKAETMIKSIQMQIYSFYWHLRSTVGSSGGSRRLDELSHRRRSAYL